MICGEPGKTVSLKGQGRGIRLIISPGPPLESVIKEARKILNDASFMVRDMEIAIETGSRPLDGKAVVALLEGLVWPLSLKISRWDSEDAGSRTFLIRSGLSVEAAAPAPSVPVPAGQVLVVDRSLRSGQKVSHAGDVLVLGDVHDGAEVTAAGNICVFGRLSGVVHAGSDGDDQRFVAADSFMATQIRIGNKVSNDITPSSHGWWGRPVIVTVERGSFQITERK